MRFFLSEKTEVSDGKIMVYDKDLIFQILKVLRKKKDDELIFLDNEGFEYLSKIKNTNSKLIIFEILKKEKNKNEPKTKLTLFQAVIKKNKMDFVFEKGTEIGVFKFCPFLSKHSVKLGVNLTRAKKIVKEASEQSERGVIPEVCKPESLKDVINKIKSDDAFNLVCLERSNSQHIIDFALEHKKIKKINLFVGPEGGFAKEDLNLLEDLPNLFFLSLGKRILKSETASLVAASLFLLKS